MAAVACAATLGAESLCFRAAVGFVHDLPVVPDVVPSSSSTSHPKMVVQAEMTLVMVRVDELPTEEVVKLVVVEHISAVELVHSVG
jgi:hypothetical protein